MSSNNQVSTQIETIEKIIKELNEISLLCSEAHLKIKIEGLQSLVFGIVNLERKISVEDVIYEKNVRS